MNGILIYVVGMSLLGIKQIFFNDPSHAYFIDSAMMILVNPIIIIFYDYLLKPINLTNKKYLGLLTACLLADATLWDLVRPVHSSPPSIIGFATSFIGLVFIFAFGIQLVLAFNLAKQKVSRPIASLALIILPTLTYSAMALLSLLPLLMVP